MRRDVCAELPGSVIRLESAEGAVVDEGDVLLVIESMKMEIPVLAQARGTVLSFGVSPGDVVHDGDVMVVLEDA